MKRKPKILVVGSFVMDQIVSTEIFPQQGETILAKSFRKAPGGKGANQAVQMARLDASVTMVGKLGRDANGSEMLRVCEAAGIDTSHVCYDETASSGCAVIILEEVPGRSAENRILVVPGSNMTIRAEDISFLRDAIGEYDLVVLQLEIPMEINVLVAEYARESGVPVMLNPAPSAEIPLRLLQCLNYIMPNEHEAAAISGVPIPRTEDGVDMDAVKAAAKKLQELGVENVLITLGSCGAYLATKDAEIFSPAVKDCRAIDPTAAGDSFIGAFCTAICGGNDPEAALRFANRTASLTVSRMGAMPSLPTLSEVEKVMVD